MKKFYLILISIIISTAAVYTQNTVRLGDELLATDNFDKSLHILTAGGMVIEPIEDMFGMVSDNCITVSNGWDAAAPIFCKVEALNDNGNDNRIRIVTFIHYNGCSGLEEELTELGYQLFEEGSYMEYIHSYDSKHFVKGCRNVRISRPDKGTGVIVEFMLDRNNDY